jgi:hypothetical protein
MLYLIIQYLAFCILALELEPEQNLNDAAPQHWMKICKILFLIAILAYSGEIILPSFLVFGKKMSFTPEQQKYKLY